MYQTRFSSNSALRATKKRTQRLLLMRGGCVASSWMAVSTTLNQSKPSDLYWKYDLIAKAAFITKETINTLIAEEGIRGDVGLLSIDIDGMDYWVWEAMDVVSPRIVICEYNSLFGSKHSVVVPYDPKFTRQTAHFSWLLFGASLPALCELATKKAMYLLAVLRLRTDAFLIRRDCADSVPALTAQSGFVLSQFRDARDQARETFVRSRE